MLIHITEKVVPQMTTDRQNANFYKEDVLKGVLKKKLCLYFLCFAMNVGR